MPATIKERNRYTITSTSNTWSHRVFDGANRLLLVRFASRNVAAVAPAYDGTSLTLVTGSLGDVSSSTNRRVAAWYYMVAPPVGTYDLTLDPATTDSNNCTLHVFNLVNVDQTTPFRGQSGSVDALLDAATTGATSTVTITTENTDLIMEAISSRRDPTTGASQTVLGAGGFTTGTELSSAKDGSSTSTTVNWTYSSSDPRVQSVIAVRFSSATQPDFADYAGSRGKKSWIASAHLAGEILSAGSTTYCGLNPSIETGATSTIARTPIRFAGTLSTPVVRISANATTADTVITLREDASDTSVTITVPAGQVGSFLGTGTASAGGSSDYGWKLVAGTGGTITVTMLSLAFEPSGSNTISFPATHTASSAKITPSSTNYGQLTGTRGATATESIAQLLVPMDATWGGLNVVQTGTTTNGTMTFKSRKNGADGNQVVTYSASEGGVKGDFSNTDTLVDGDRVAVYLNNAGTVGDFELERYMSTLSNSSGEFLLTSADASSGTGLNVLTGTVYLPVAGELKNGAAATEADAQMRAPFDMALKRLIARVGGNTSVGNTDVVLRVNGADTTLKTYHMPSAPEITIADEGDVVEVSAGDLLSLKLIHTGATNTIRFRSFSLVGIERVAGAGFSVTDVDTDETIVDAQTGVVVTITGTVSATGKKVFITQGSNSVEQTVTAQNASSATITVSYGGVLSAGAATLCVRNPL